MSATEMTEPSSGSPTGTSGKKPVESKTAAARPPQFSTLSVHAGEARQKPGDSITDPIFCASTYTFADTQSVIDFIEQEQPREEYGRYGNPGERVAERKLAALEGGEMAVLFRQRHGGDRRPVDVEAQRRRRSDFLRRVLSPQPRVLQEAPVAVRREDDAGPHAATTTRWKRRSRRRRSCWSANRRRIRI